jgi:hypothetical protein|tara:strand:+ start:515 stop:625 length:111 start_codon:yes stop_codon:yes gene_type:complete
MILGLPLASFVALFGAPALVIAVMIYCCWRISRAED